MAVALDVLTRVVKIQVGAARFVAGGSDSGGKGTISDVDFPALRFYTELAGTRFEGPKPYPEWIETEVLFDVPHPSGGHKLCSFLACAYGAPFLHEGDEKGTPTFVFGGNGVDFLSGLSFSYIQTSNNGMDWSQTFTYPSFSYVYAMTFDAVDNAFYAAMIHGPGGNATNEVLLKSRSGKSWSEVGRQVIEGGVKYTSLLEPHCSDRIKNEANQPLPSGLYGYDAGKQILIAPHPTPFWHGTLGGEGPNIQIQTTDEEGNKHIAITPLAGFERVNAVAFAGGIWQAAGFSPGDAGTGIIATSIDDGRTWDMAFTSATKSHGVSVICGTEDL